VTHQACADFGRLPLAASSMDMLWSNLALHWHPQPHRVMREWARVLRADGLLMFSAFGPDTFAELRMAYAKAGLGPAVLPFVDLHDYGDMMIEAGFADPVMDMEKLNITYSSSDELLADVRAFGGNPLVERKPGLTGRAAFAALKRGLDEQKAADGRISLSVEVVYGHAFRSLPKKNLAGESIVHLHRR
jgi:malonyl-CoA O-methyltransferase